MTADYHMHTPLCRHAEGNPSAYADRALELGLPEIGFSDHSPMPSLFDDWRMLIEELPQYFVMVEEARASHPTLPIRLGLECDFLPGHEPWLEKLAGLAEWDYLIGSVHYIAPDWDVDNPKWLGSGRWAQHTVEEIWLQYTKACVEGIRSGLFDFWSHPDLVKKFGHRPPGDLSRYYEPVIQALVDTKGAFEINTAGLRNPSAEIYPAPGFLKMAATAGLSLVISSDAHQPGIVGHEFPAAIRLARECGFTHTLRFEKRQRRLVHLPEL